MIHGSPSLSLAFCKTASLNSESPGLTDSECSNAETLTNEIVFRTGRPTMIHESPVLGSQDCQPYSKSSRRYRILRMRQSWAIHKWYKGPIPDHPSINPSQHTPCNQYAGRWLAFHAPRISPPGLARADAMARILMLDQLLKHSRALPKSRGASLALFAKAPGTGSTFGQEGSFRELPNEIPNTKDR